MSSVRLKLLDTQNIYGTMNSGTVKLSNLTDADKVLLMHRHNLEYLSDVDNLKLDGADRAAIFKRHRRQFAKDEGFAWKKMFMADQVKLDGSVFEITKEYVEANPDGWTDIPEDILMIRSDLPGVAIGHPVADCAVVVAEDRKQGITTVAHCGGKMIDKKIPMMAIEALYSEGSKPEDIFVNVGSRAGDSWIYVKNRPDWATDPEIWDETGAIIPGKLFNNGQVVDAYKINQDKALAYQFALVGIPEENITYDEHDTIKDPNYYSNSKAISDPEKQGRQFIGAVYQKVR